MARVRGEGRLRRAPALVAHGNCARRRLGEAGYPPRYGPQGHPELEGLLAALIVSLQILAIKAFPQNCDLLKAEVRSYRYEDRKLN